MKCLEDMACRTTPPIVTALNAPSNGNTYLKDNSIKIEDIKDAAIFIAQLVREGATFKATMRENQETFIELTGGF